MFRYNFLRRRQNFEKTGQKGIFRHILENVDQKIALFPHALRPQNLVYIGAEGAFRKL